MKRLQLM